MIKNTCNSVGTKSIVNYSKGEECKDVRSSLCVVEIIPPISAQIIRMYSAGHEYMRTTKFSKFSLKVTLADKNAVVNV